MHLQELLYYNSSKDYVKGKLCYYFNILSQAILPLYRAILDNIYREHFNEPGFDRVAQLNFPFHERVFATDVETGEESGSGRVNLETAEDQRLAAEEYVASIAESGAPKPNWWKEFLQSVRMWIADHFPHARQVRMTDREIETLLARSARAARRNRRGNGKVIAPESMIRFRVNENGETVFGIAGRDGDFTAREIMEDKTISENTPILTSDGSEVWGEITPEMAEAGKELGLEALPIKLLKGKHFGNHAGFGLAHLWNQHGAELEARGYDLSDFLTGVFGKPNQIYASRQGDNIRLELVTKSRPRNIGVLELRKKDGFYSVVTAFPIEKDSHQFRGNKIWTYEGSAHTKSKQRTQSLEPLSGDQRLQPPLEDRGIQTNNNITSSGEKSSGNTGAVYSVDSVWTGSAASYDAPSLQYIGTGEGQQVFGWGLYGSSSREVAEWYAKADVARKRNPAQNDLVVYLDGKKLNDPNSDKDVSDLVWFVFHFGETYVREFAEQNAKLSYSGLEEYSRMRDANPEMRNESGKNQERDEKTLELLDRIKIEENEDPLIWDAVSGLSSARMKPSERHSTADIEQRLRSDLRNVLERKRKFYQELASKNKSVRIREINQRKADAYERAIAKLPSLSREELTTGGLPHNLYQQTFWPGKEENLLDWDKKVPKKQIQKIADQAVKEGLPFGYTENGKNFFNGSATSGELLYHELAKPFNLGSPKAASEFLYRAGIDGVTYIGDSSRVRNYVAFSDQDIRVDEHIMFQAVGDKFRTIRDALPEETGETPLLSIPKNLPNRITALPEPVISDIKEAYGALPSSVTDAWGDSVYLKEDRRGDMRLVHYITSDTDTGGRGQGDLDPSRIPWLPRIAETVAKAQVMLRDFRSRNRIYVRNYAEGMHLVVTSAEGKFIGQKEYDTSAITQFPENDRRVGTRDRFTVEKERGGMLQSGVAAPSDGAAGSASLAESDSTDQMPGIAAPSGQAVGSGSLVEPDSASPKSTSTEMSDTSAITADSLTESDSTEPVADNNIYPTPDEIKRAIERMQNNFRKPNRVYVHDCSKGAIQFIIVTRKRLITLSSLCSRQRTDGDSSSAPTSVNGSQGNDPSALTSKEEGGKRSPQSPSTGESSGDAPYSPSAGTNVAPSLKNVKLLQGDVIYRGATTFTDNWISTGSIPTGKSKARSETAKKNRRLFHPQPPAFPRIRYWRRKRDSNPR